jgi:predicted XRE-type DNA-binding protein
LVLLYLPLEELSHFPLKLAVRLPLKHNTGLAELLKGMKKRKEISRKAKEAVERYGYSQKDVADYLGVHYSTVSRMVNKGM